MGGREAAGAGGGSERACGPGTVSAIVDDFDDGVISGPWTPSNDPSVVESGGLLQLTPGSEAEDVHGVQTEVGYSLLGCSIHAELVAPPRDGEAVVALFQLRNGTDAFVRWAVNETTIVARMTDGASDLPSLPLALDPYAHRWLRIRESDGTVYFETSADGHTWATFMSGPTPSFADSARVSVRTHTVIDVQTPSTTVVQFDRVNVAPE